MKHSDSESDGIKIEIDTETLARLISRRQVGACELKCLDADSKRLVWKLCLRSCLNSKS